MAITLILSSIYIPRDSREANLYEKKLSRQREISTLKENNMWELVSQGKRQVGCKWDTQSNKFLKDHS